MDLAGNTAAGRSALAKASWRLLPLIALGYGVSYMDRVNISFAAVRMNADLGFSATVYGLGGGLFFLAYALMEVPSNLMLARVGARRWLALILAVWGALAVAMMFVRTPGEFYAMRVLLGAAESGFFPGAVYHLTHWYPAAWRGRAISGFYIAYPLANVVMGALAGALLGLDGVLGLRGWQWLFLIEGLPAVLLSGVFLAALPETPARAVWLTPDEKHWIAAGLAADRARLAREPDPGLRATLTSPVVIAVGAANFLVLGANYAFGLSAPAFLTGATGLSVAAAGYLIAAGGLLGGLGMLALSHSSDRRGERFLHLAAPLALAGLAYGLMGQARSPGGVMAGFLLAQAAMGASATVIWLIPSDRLSGRSAAAGVAAIGTIGMIGSFLLPFGWGVLKDRTGGFGTGVALLPVAFLGAAAIILCLRGVARREAEGAPHALPLDM